MKTRQLLLCALFAALTAAGIFIRVPIPGTMMNFTMQTFFVFLAGMLLTPRYALISQLVYIAIGLIGLPVFSKGGGLGYVLEPSFGFLPGFALCAFLLSVLIRRKMADKQTPASIIKTGFLSLLSIAAMYVLGITYMYAIFNIYLNTPVTLEYVIVTATGIFFFIDIIKFVLAFILGTAVLKRLPDHT